VFAYETHAVRVVFGPGALAALPDVLQRISARRVLVVTTPGRSAERSTLTQTLGDACAGVFDRAVVHVPAEVVKAALEEATQSGADAVLALGGGSAIGVAKAMALESTRPVIAVPTTYSGSEMTAVWGITDAGAKRTGRDRRAAPRAVLYEPALTLSLPPDVSAASGMNAIAHCVEALYAVDGHPVATLLAESGLRTLALSLPDVVRHPADLAARGDALLGSHLAGRALDLTSMGLHHRMCHVLGGSFGLPHALTHAVLLPYVVAYNAPAAAAEALRVVADALGSPDAWTGLFALTRGLGLTSTLADLGLGEADIDRAAELTTQGAYPNPRTVTRAGVRAVLAAAYAGAPPTPF
jgi:maleylacetate reductase